MNSIPIGEFCNGLQTSMKICPTSIADGCLLGAAYVQKGVHALNDRFLDLSTFNATMIFSPPNMIFSPSDRSDQITNTELWPKRILLKFQYIAKESDMCKGALSESTKTLRHACENKTIIEVWRVLVAIWSGILIGLNLCSYGKRLYSFHQV